MLHTGLSSDKWRSFSVDKQILMIANELNRAKHWVEKKDFDKVHSCYERAFELIDLSVGVAENYSFLKEMLRLRERLGMAYIQRSCETFDSTLYHILLGMNVSSCNLLGHNFF